MLNKLKKDYEDFIKARKEIEDLKRHIEHLEECNKAWVLTANKSLQNFVDLAIKTKEIQ